VTHSYHLAISPLLGLFLGLLLVLLNGFFVAAEFALVKVRPTQLDLRRDARGRLARHMVSHLDSYLSATQLGITLASLALGWIGEPAFAWLLEPLVRRLPFGTAALLHSISLTAAFLLITILHIVLGELVPKSLAIRKSERTSLWVAAPLYLFYKASYPAIWLLNHAANGMLRLVGVPPVTESELQHTEEELRRLVGSIELGRQTPLKRELLDNIFELSQRVARQIMVPRYAVVYLDVHRPLEDNLRKARESGHTRFPLCEGDLDRVVGLVHIKDLFRATKVPASIREIARPVTFMPETLTLDRLLKRMRAERIHLAPVHDEHGAVSGIVTLENVIEEIVGPIQDEFDDERPELVKKGENVYHVSAGMLVVDLEDELELEFSDQDDDTVGGVVLSKLGRPPRVGDRVSVGPLALEVLEVGRNRARTLRVTVSAPAPAADRAPEG
jgi:CBS domain containing-hemolysin-like protein